MHHLQLLADSAMEAQFEPGQWIFRQGDPANRFYLILEGNVLIELEVKDCKTRSEQLIGLPNSSRKSWNLWVWLC